MITDPRRTIVPRLAALCLVLSGLVGGVSACTSDPGASAAASQASISIQRPTIDWPANPSVAAVRMVVRNRSSDADELISVSSPIARSATIHRSQEDALGRSTMVPQERLAIPARSSVTFAPSGLHVMLTGITEEVQVGDKVRLTLVFRDVGRVTATATVIEPGTEESHGH